MNDDNKIITIGILIVGLIIGGVLGSKIGSRPYVGGIVHNVQETFDAGLAVQGTEIVDSSGNWVGAITGTSATLSTTLTIDGETQTDRIVSGGDVVQIGYGTTTATAAQICNDSVIQVGLMTDAVATLTLPATTTLHADCLGANGKNQSILVHNNATSTLALTIVAGSGIDLQEPVGGDVVVAETEYARIFFTRISSATSTAEVHNHRVAD